MWNCLEIVKKIGLQILAYIQLVVHSNIFNLKDILIEI